MYGESPIYSVSRNPSFIDYPGKIAMLCFVSGCNFRCNFCHNVELIEKSNRLFGWKQLEATFATANDQWIDGVVITGGEPTTCDSVFEVIDMAKKFGLLVKVDTNGSNPTHISRLVECVDCVAMDVKCSLKKYKDVTGFEDTQKIVDSINTLLRSKANVIFRTTAIESIHSESDIEEIAKMIVGARNYVIQPFVPRTTILDERMSTRTSRQFLEKMKSVASDILGDGIVSIG